MTLRNLLPCMTVVAGLLCADIARADTTQARCDVYPKGSDRVAAMLPCTFSQRQGNVTIRLDDGRSYDLLPSADVPGNYTDQWGRPAYRNSDLGRAGVIFRLADSSIYVYWNTAALEQSGSDRGNPTAPYSTADYDATMLLRCRESAGAELRLCPAGALRMDNHQASIVITSPLGEEFTINFMTDYVNATAGAVKASLEGDTWTVIVEGLGIFEVPLAAIEGG